MATKTQDYTKMMKDMMGAFPVDMSAMQDAFKTQAALAEQMSKVALEAAEKSTEISSKWTKDTLAKLGFGDHGQGRAGRLHQGDDRFRLGAGRDGRRDTWPPSPKSRRRSRWKPSS